MNIKSILITSDDGYNALGVRVLSTLLKDKYNVKIAGTIEQMSGVGGKLSLKGGSFGITEVDGVEALYVDGTPSDAVEVANSYYSDPFDLVLSGINWGQNTGGGVVSSGTVSVALRALVIGITQRAIALSWRLPGEHWTKRHSGDESISEYLEYPGAAAIKLTKQSIDQDFWGCDMLNVNLPAKPSNQVIFAKPLHNRNNIYPPALLDFEKLTFQYPASYHPEAETNIEYDSAALEAGHITISPFKGNYLNEKVWEEVKHLTLELT